MRSIRYMIWAGLWLVAVPSAAAQQTLTLEECRELALRNNKQISVAAQGSLRAAHEAKSYKANFFPRLSATGNYLYSTAGFNRSFGGGYLPTFVPDGSGALVPNILTTVDGTPLFKEYAYFPGLELDLKLSGTYTAGISLEQPVYTGGKITAAYRMSRIAEEMAGLNQTLARTQVILQTDEAYWTHMQALELAKTAEAYQVLVAELLKDLQNAYDAGLKPRNDLLRVRVALNEAELQAVQAENAVRLSRMNLCHVTGLPLESDIAVGGTEPDSVFETLPAADLTARPEYGLLSRQIDLREEEGRLARSEFLPNVGVMGNFGYANGMKLNGEKLLDKTSFSAVVSVGIPIFHANEGRHKVKSAAAERNIALLQREEATEQMELELQQALNRWEESLLETALTARSLEQATENLKVSRDYYDAGMQTLADHLEAQALWQRARSESIRARTAARLNETRYLKAAGRL